MCFCGWGKSLSITPMMTVLYYYSGIFCGEFVDEWHPDADRILMVLPKMPFYSLFFCFSNETYATWDIVRRYFLVLFGASDPSSGTMTPVESPSITLNHDQPWHSQPLEKPLWSPITLWWTNIAMENHHFQWVNPLFRLGHVQLLC